MNPKQHAKPNTVVRVIAFLLVVALVYGALTRLLTVNDATEQQYVHSFYLEPKNSLDVMILGASETFTDYPARRWRGSTPGLRAIRWPCRPHGTIYPSMLREAPSGKIPSVYVVEVNGFLYTENEREELSARRTRKWIDTIPLSRSKLDRPSRVHPGRSASTYYSRCSNTTRLECAGPHPQFAVTAAAGARRGLFVHQAVSVHLHVPHGDG